MSERPDARTWHRTTGLGLAGLGLAIISVAAAVNATTAPAVGEGGDTAGTLAGTFAASTFGLGVTKTGIAIILIGIVLGMMAAIVQFVLYGVAASTAADPAVWVSWLGPFREVALGVLLAGIVLALASIAEALGFQFHRLHQLAVIGNREV